MKALSQGVPSSDLCNPPSTGEEEGTSRNWGEDNGLRGGCDVVESRQRVGAVGESETEVFTESKEAGVEEEAWQTVEVETEKGGGGTEKSTEAFERSTCDHDHFGASDTAVPLEGEDGRRPSNGFGFVPEGSLLDARSGIDLGQRWCAVPQPVISAVRSFSTFSSEGGAGVGGVENFGSCMPAPREVREAVDNGLSLVRGSGLGRSDGGVMKSPVGNEEKVGQAAAGELLEGFEKNISEKSSDVDESNPPVTMDEVRTAPGAVSKDAHDVLLSKEISGQRYVDSSVPPIGKEQALVEAETTLVDRVCLTMIRAIMKMELPPLDDAAVAMPTTPSVGILDGANAYSSTGHEAGAETRQQDLNREDTMVPVAIEFTRPPPLRPPTAPLRPRFDASKLPNDASPDVLSGGDGGSAIGMETSSFLPRANGSSIDTIGGLGHKRRSSTGSSLRNTSDQSAFRSVAVAGSTCRNDKATTARSTFSGVNGDERRGEASDTYCMFSPVKLFLSWRRKIGNKTPGGAKRYNNNSKSVGRYTDGGIGRFRSGIESELMEVPPAPPSPAGFPGAGHFLPEDSDSDSDSDLESDANGDDDGGVDVGDTSDGARAMMDAETLVAGVVEMLRSQVCNSLPRRGYTHSLACHRPRTLIKSVRSTPCFRQTKQREIFTANR